MKPIEIPWWGAVLWLVVGIAYYLYGRHTQSERRMGTGDMLATAGFIFLLVMGLGWLEVTYGTPT